jgi:hypothetical protein
MMQIEVPDEVDCNDAFPQPGRRFQEWHGAVPPGIVNQYMAWTELRFDSGNGGFDSCAIGNVAGETRRVAARRGARFGDLTGGRGIEIQNSYACAGFGEASANGAADSTTTTGYHGRLVFETLHLLAFLAHRPDAVESRSLRTFPKRPLPSPVARYGTG